MANTSSPASKAPRAMKKATTPSTRSSTPKRPRNATLMRSTASKKHTSSKQVEIEISSHRFLHFYLNALYVILFLSISCVSFLAYTTADGVLDNVFSLSGLSLADHFSFSQQTVAAADDDDDDELVIMDADSRLPLYKLLRGETNCSSEAVREGTSVNATVSSVNATVRTVNATGDCSTSLPLMVAQAHMDANALTQSFYNPVRATHNALRQLPAPSSLWLAVMKEKVEEMLSNTLSPLQLRKIVNETKDGLREIWTSAVDCETKVNLQWAMESGMFLDQTSDEIVLVQAGGREVRVSRQHGRQSTLVIGEKDIGKDSLELRFEREMGVTKIIVENGEIGEI